MIGEIRMVDGFLETKDLKIGMRATVDQLSHIINKYMILVYDNMDDEVGTLVYIGNRRTKEFEKWFMQDKPITPIHHTKMDLEENVVYDD